MSFWLESHFGFNNAFMLQLKNPTYNKWKRTIYRAQENWLFNNYRGLAFPFYLSPSAMWIVLLMRNKVAADMIGEATFASRLQSGNFISALVL
jgi:hypothetical protein